MLVDNIFYDIRIFNVLFFDVGETWKIDQGEIDQVVPANFDMNRSGGDFNSFSL